MKIEYRFVNYRVAYEESRSNRASDIASPLTDLTKKKKKKDRSNNIKDWQDHYEKAFQTLTNRLTSSPIFRLRIFQNLLPFILRTNTSDTGLGAVLRLEFEGEGKLSFACEVGNLYLGKGITR